MTKRATASGFFPERRKGFSWGFTQGPKARVQRLVHHDRTDAPQNWGTIAEVRPDPRTLSGYAGVEYHTWFCTLPLENPRWWRCERFYLNNVDLIRVSGNDYSMKVRIVAAKRPMIERDGPMMDAYSTKERNSQVPTYSPVPTFRGRLAVLVRR